MLERFSLKSLYKGVEETFLSIKKEWRYLKNQFFQKVCHEIKEKTYEW